MKKQLLVLAGLSTLLLGACGNEQTVEENTEQPAETEQANKETPKVNLGDTFESEDGSYKLTLTQATRDKSGFPSYITDNDGGEYDVENMAQFTVEYENVSIDEGLEPSSLSFQVYDKNGKQLKVPGHSDSGGSASPGRTGVMTFWANVPKEETKVEIDYLPLDKQTADVTFVTDIK